MIPVPNRTEVILSQFANSWTETENHFRYLLENHDFKRLKPILLFIEGLKSNGENKFFRIGSSVDGLLISRSVNHGLRRDQKFIRIEAYDNKFGVVLRDGDKTYREYMLDELNDPRLINLLNTLKDTLVD
jgi:hypothetical protein